MGEKSPPREGGRNGRSGRIRTCDPRVPNAVLYQTEPHSDLEGRLIEEAFRGRKRPLRRCIRERVTLSPRPRAGATPSPFLLGNGVMVTLRFLVPSF